MVERTPTRGQEALAARQAAPPRDFSPPAPPRSGDTVVVACKIPNGIVLRVYEMVDFNEPSPAGARTVKRSQPKGAPVRINGSNIPIPTDDDELANFLPPVAGYALTVVPKDFWEEWLEQNADSDLIKNRVLFAAMRQNDAIARAREQAREKVKSGFEPINPKDPPKVGMKINQFAEKVSG